MWPQKQLILISCSPFKALCERETLAFPARWRFQHFHHISAHSQVIKTLMVALSPKHNLNLVIKACLFLQLWPVAGKVCDPGSVRGGSSFSLLSAALPDPCQLAAASEEPGVDVGAQREVTCRKVPTGGCWLASALWPSDIHSPGQFSRPFVHLCSWAFTILGPEKRPCFWLAAPVSFLVPLRPVCFLPLSSHPTRLPLRAGAT